METSPAVIVDDESALKRSYAAALLKHPQTPEGRFQAALSLTSDTGRALWMANKWIDDPVVVAAQTELVAASDNGELDFIGTKAEFCREVLEYARSCWEPETKHKFYKLYADTRGFISKPDTQVNVQINQNKVMVVKDLGSDSDWEAKARKQQGTLLDVAASRH